MEPNHSPAYLIIKVKAIEVNLVFHDGRLKVWNPDTFLRLNCSSAPTARVDLMDKNVMMNKVTTINLIRMLYQ